MNAWNVDDLRPGLDADYQRMGDFALDLGTADDRTDVIRLAMEAAARLVAAGQAGAKWAASLAALA